MATKKTTTNSRYYEAVGRRKTAVARVRITPASKASWIVNDRDLATYFSTDVTRALATSAPEAGERKEKFAVTVKVMGGGEQAQAEAVRLGTARAIVSYTPEARTELKHRGYLKRDPRKVERKKFGLKKARRAAQWSKR